MRGVKLERANSPPSSQLHCYLPQTDACLPTYPPTGAASVCVPPVKPQGAFAGAPPCPHHAGLCALRMGKLRHEATSCWEVRRVKSARLAWPGRSPIMNHLPGKESIWSPSGSLVQV